LKMWAEPTLELGESGLTNEVQDILRQRLRHTKIKYLVWVLCGLGLSEKHSK